MIKIKSVESKTTPSKLNISVSDVQIIDGTFMDENGNIAHSINDTLSDYGIDTFSIKISVEIPTEDE